MAYQKIPSLGQSNKAGSLPVTLASDQDDVKITLDSEAVVLGAGTAAIGKLAANNGVDIGDVDVTSLPAITGTVTANAGTNLNTSALALETGGNLASIKAKTDNIPALGQALAAASVPVVLPAAQVTTLTPPAAITNFANETGGNLATIAGKDFATQTTLAAINSKLVTGTDIGDVTINNGSGANAVNIQDGGNTITVDGTVAVTNAGITTIAGAVSGTEMQVDVVSLPTVTANATLAAETTKVIGTVNIAASQTVGLAAGSAAIGKLAANDGVDIGNVDVASIAAGDNNIGNVDIASALPAGTNAIGKLLPPDIDITTHTNYARKYYTSSGAATDGIVWSPAAGKRWHVTSLIFQVSADATVTFEDDKSGGDDPVLKGEFKAGSGMALTFDEKYPFASGEDAADLTVTTTAGNIYVSVVGYEI